MITKFLPLQMSSEFLYLKILMLYLVSPPNNQIDMIVAPANLI